MVPQLNALRHVSDKEEAIRTSYFRMVLLLRSLVALNNVQHFQTVASVTRSLFELYLDIKTLASGSCDKTVRRYWDFVEVERYRTAKQLLRFAEKHPNTLGDLEKQRAYCDDEEREKKSQELQGRQVEVSSALD
jgi:Family of unknown function (DUF5677)